MTMIILILLAMLDAAVLAWIIIEQQRRILDALHTLIAQASTRRGWARGEHADV